MALKELIEKYGYKPSDECFRFKEEEIEDGYLRTGVKYQGKEIVIKVIGDERKENKGGVSVR